MNHHDGPSKVTWQRIQPDSEDGLAEVVHHFKDRVGELEQVLPLAVKEQPTEGFGVLTSLIHLLNDLKQGPQGSRVYVVQ